MTRNRGRLMAAGGAAAVALLAAGAADAQQRTFNVPSEELARAIPEFALQADIQIVAPVSALRGVRSRSVQGVFDVRTALAMMLGNTGLEVANDTGGVVSLRLRPQRVAFVKSETSALGALNASALAAAAAAAEAPKPARASPDNALEEVIVTARRREENLQSTPVAITALSGDMMEKRNVVNLAQITRIAPNATTYETFGSVGYVSAFIRGIGYVDNKIGQDTTIGLYIDGVAYGRFATGALDLVEPERIEVLRGPQGTLFGRNTTGGAFIITTHMPRDEFGGMVKGSYGTFNSRTVRARIDSGLLGGSGIKFSAAFQQRDQDGVHDDGTQPRNLDPGARKVSAYWFKAVGEWDRLAATLSVDYNETEGVPVNPQVVDATAAVRNFVALSPTYGGGSYTISRSGLFTIPSDGNAGLQRVWDEGVALTLNYRISDNLSLKSISAVRALKRYDPASYGPGDLRGNVGTAAAPRIASFNGLFEYPRRGQGARQRSQEVQLSGTAGDFEYVAGVYYFKEKAWESARQRIALVQGTGLTAVDLVTERLYNVDSKSVAEFGQVNWRPGFLDKKLELSAGVRHTKDTRDFRQSIPVVRSGHLSSANTSYLMSANYQWTDGLMTYVRYSTGYRAGGFNPVAPPAGNTVFLPEKLKSVEGGFKLDMLDRRLRLNGAAFHTKYTDLQVAQFSPPGLAGSGGTSTVSADARYEGFELEIEAAPVAGLTLTASLGYVSTKYLKFPRGLDSGLVSPGCLPITSSAGAILGQDCAAIAAAPFNPKVTTDVSATYVLPAASYGTWSVSANYSRRSSVYNSNFRLPSTPFREVLRSKGYGLLSGRIALSDIPLNGQVKAQIAVFGDNLTNKKYEFQGTDFGSYATIVFGQRRTVGLEGKVEF